MRENRTSGTEWGVLGNRHSYHNDFSRESIKSFITSSKKGCDFFMNFKYLYPPSQKTTYEK